MVALRVALSLRYQVVPVVEGLAVKAKPVKQPFFLPVLGEPVQPGRINCGHQVLEPVTRRRLVGFKEPPVNRFVY